FLSHSHVYDSAIKREGPPQARKYPIWHKPLGTAHEHMDIRLDDRPMHELESIAVVHADQILPAAANAPPPRASWPSGSVARNLLSQPSKIMTGVQGFASRVGGDKNHPGKTTAASGAKGLRFLDKKAGGWKAVEKRFDQFAVDSRLHKESFGRCIGESLLIFCRCDKNGDGKLSENEIRQLETLIRGMVSSQVTERTLKRSQGHARRMIPKRYRYPVNRFVGKATDFILDNWKRIWVFSLWLTLNAVLAAWKFYQYERRAAFEVMGYCVCVAKAAAETLKLNMALILIPVCRNTLTRLRSTRLSSVFPFDDNINFHKAIALAITIGTLVHTLAHLTCDFPRLITCPKSKFMRLLGPNFHYKQPTYPSLLASVPGVTGILMIIIMAFSFTLATHSFRRSVVKLPPPLHHLAGFNAFWYAHHLLAVVYVLLIVHSYFLFLTKEWYKKTVGHVALYSA
ncbi:hypothetical protein GW17_00034520, partial [Ensete ventricosum]